MNGRIETPHYQIANFCRRSGIRRLALFSSALREVVLSDFPRHIAQLSRILESEA
jgi:hypothetical protein